MGGIGVVNVSLFRHAFVLILLALLGAFFLPAMAVPRLGLSAHTIGLLSGVLLLVLGAIWQQFQLSDLQRGWLKWLWIYSSYANWLGCLVGGVFGAGRMTPIASAGFEGAPLPEMIVTLLLGSVALTALPAVGLALWGLRRRDEVVAHTATRPAP